MYEFIYAFIYAFIFICAFIYACMPNLHNYANLEKNIDFYMSIKNTL